MDKAKGLSSIFSKYSTMPVSFETRQLEMADEKDNRAWIRI